MSALYWQGVPEGVIIVNSLIGIIFLSYGILFVFGGRNTGDGKVVSFGGGLIALGVYFLIAAIGRVNQ